MFLIYWYNSKTQLQESQLSQYDRVSSLPCFLKCDTVTFYITYHSMSDLTVSYTIHHMNCFQQITCLAFFPIVTRFVFCFQLVYDWHATWSTWKVTHEWHVLSHDFHMINILCTAVSWSTCQRYCHTRSSKSPECLSHVIWCFQQLSRGWPAIVTWLTSNCHMVDSLYSVISMECHTCLYCCLSRSHYDRMIHCWPSNSGPFVYVGYGRSDTAGVSWRSTWMSCWTWCRWSGSGC